MNKQATSNRVSNNMQMPTLSCSLPNGTTQYRKTTFATSSTLHVEVGFPWITFEPQHKARLLQSQRASTRLLAQTKSVWFFSDLANWTTVAACATAAAAARTLHLYERPICNIAKDFRRHLLEVLLCSTGHQPTVHGKKLQRDRINLSSCQIGRALPTGDGLLDSVCQLGGGIHKQEARETIDHKADECVCPVSSSKLDARPERSVSAHWVTDSTCFRKKNAHEFEQARCAQRMQLLGGLCRSDAHHGTRKELQDGPLHAQLAALANLTEPPLSSAFIPLLCLISIFLMSGRVACFGSAE